MSNHIGSYMLNEILYILSEMGISETIGKQRTRKFALKLVRIGKRYDCNNNEILDSIGEEIGICYLCLKETEDIEDGLCQTCRK
ncbi:hypothetical protein [Clostridium estertheticum]|uniref:Uncharacterized protein n=1 Tax=Clostridium estertheticum TaxID=238834 RepID=A0A7Y3SZX5_9CLOT|nr:hypothetical protein [Clostridium estertheticum]NNU78145.1 hypothetical protein [Clostridium estertheticum]WBL47742.1 hypothetical protein LOR37_03365 [Clostridium estertheticum]